MGLYGRGKQVAIRTVSDVLSAVVNTFTLAYKGNPIKANFEKSLVKRLAQMMEGWKKEDTPTKDNLTGGIHVPEFLVDLGMAKHAN